MRRSRKGSPFSWGRAALLIPQDKCNGAAAGRPFDCVEPFASPNAAAGESTQSGEEQMKIIKTGLAAAGLAALTACGGGEEVNNMEVENLVVDNFGTEVNMTTDMNAVDMNATTTTDTNTTNM